MLRHPLLNQLVAAPAALRVPKPGGTVVAPMGAPPANMRFGPLSPGITTSQRFTGGAVGHPLSPVHPAPPGFAAPSYAAVPGSGMRTAPVLAALAASGAIAGGTPGIGPTSLPPGAGSPSPVSTVLPTPPPSAWGAPREGPLATPPPSAWGPPIGGTLATPPPSSFGGGGLSSVLAALAQRGVKPTAYQL